MQLYEQTEVTLKASTRLGIDPVGRDMLNMYGPVLRRCRDRKRYELRNHLGNVLAVVSDRKFAQDGGGNQVSYFKAQQIAAADYFPYGQLHPGRYVDVRDYRYGYNGKEREERGEFGGLRYYYYRYRIYNPALGRFISVDPLAKRFAWVTPYNYAENSPIAYVDLWGLQKYKVVARAFIPQKKIKNPHPFSNIYWFAGDDRYYYYANSKRYRVEQSVIIDFDQELARINTNIASSTIGYDKEGNIIATSTPGRGGTIKADVKNDIAEIEFKMDAGNKLSKRETFGLAPNINMTMKLRIQSEEDCSFTYECDIKRDRFPAYEVFIINLEEEDEVYFLYGSNPIETNEDPWALYPPVEYHYQSKGKSYELPRRYLIPFR